MSEEEEVCPECYRGWGPNPPVPVVGEEETVARAIFAAWLPDWYPDDINWGTVNDRTRDHWSMLARAAIAALDLARTEGEK